VAPFSKGVPLPSFCLPSAPLKVFSNIHLGCPPKVFSFEKIFAFSSCLDGAGPLFREQEDERPACALAHFRPSLYAGTLPRHCLDMRFEK